MKLLSTCLRRPRSLDLWKRIVLFLFALTLLTILLIVKIYISISPLHFGETETRRYLEVKKQGLCGRATPGVDLTLSPVDGAGESEELGHYHGYPRLIHRLFLVWKGKSPEIPEAWSENDRICREKTPDFKHIIWDDKMVLAFFSEHYPWFLATYRAYDYDVMRVDAAKYFILYHYGGIYLDLDERCVQDIKKLIDLVPQGYGMAFPESNPSGLSNPVFMAKICHSFLSYVISRMQQDNLWYGIPYITVMLSSGPTFLTVKYHEYLDMVQTIYDEPIYVFSSDYVLKHKYIKKVKGQTWFLWDAVIIHIFYDFWRKITFQTPV